MNEEMNNNIVNNETNSNNNYEPPRGNNGVKGLLIVLIVSVLCLIGLTAYKMLVFDKKNDNKKDNNSNNDVIENNGNETDKDLKYYGLSLMSPKFPYKKIENLKNQINTIPFTKIFDKETTYKNLYITYMLKNSINKVKPIGKAISYVENIPEEDKNGKKYPDYSKIAKNDIEKKIYELSIQFGLTVEEIETMDLLQLMSDGFGGQIEIYMYDGNEIFKQLKNLYNYEDKMISGYYGGYYDLSDCHVSILYDSKINKFFYQEFGGTATINHDTLIEGFIEDNIYKIYYLHSVYNPTQEYIQDDNGNEINILRSDKSFIKKLDQYNLLHKDELMQYEISFKINGDNTYEFLEIKKLDNLDNISKPMDLETFNDSVNKYNSRVKKAILDLENQNKDKEVTDKIMYNVKNIDYTRILNDKIAHDELVATKIVGDAIKKIGLGYYPNSFGTIAPVIDMYGDRYPSYDDLYKNYSNEYEQVDGSLLIGKSLGLTVNELSKIDPNIWGSIYGCSMSYEIYNKKDVENVINKMYEGYKINIFDKNKIFHYQYLDIIYDKGVNKLVTHGCGGTFTPIVNSKIILDENLEGNIYKVKYLETKYKYLEEEFNDEPNYCYVIDKDMNKKKIDCFERKESNNENYAQQLADEYSSNHKNELPQYEVTFKINENKTYEFIDIKKVN